MEATVPAGDVFPRIFTACWINIPAKTGLPNAHKCGVSQTTLLLAGMDVNAEQVMALAILW